MPLSLYHRVVNDFHEWRTAARALLAQDIAPERVTWTETQDRIGELLPGVGLPAIVALSDPHAATARYAARVPARFLALAKVVACHRSGEQWALLYRLLWRMCHGEPELLEIAVDADLRAAKLLERAVRRDLHKMKAFVRFRSSDEVSYFAWYAPDHRILRLSAPFFVRRFASMKWMIATPDATARWDGAALSFGPGTPRDPGADAVVPDPTEECWRLYYRSIFNPARVKVDAMVREMPRRFWRGLPETLEIQPLLEAAQRRAAEMTMTHGNPSPNIDDSESAASLTVVQNRPSSAAQSMLPTERTYESLQTAATTCTACPLYANATQTVMGRGELHARVMLVGEQPGDQEDLAGAPFVGPAGQLLDTLIMEAGWRRESLYVTNAVKHFKWKRSGKRRLHERPNVGEVRACRAWLDAEIELVRPRAIICLGATAAQSFAGPTFRLQRSRGHIFEQTPWAPLWMATYHPSALLRAPDPTAAAGMHAAVVEDFRRIGARLKERGEELAVIEAPIAR